jgi:eukaryotic-like serine/threonine-protein kinase
MTRRVISHYAILEEIGRGGMGVVYLADDLILHRKVALKLLSPDLVGDTDSRRRFLTEARAAAALQHPHIAVVHETGEEGGEVFTAMEFIPGDRLADLMNRRALSVRRSIDLTIEVAEGLAHAHAKGVIHRDLKPSNIIVNEEGFAKIIDFGLAKLLRPLGPRVSTGVTPARGSTEPGILVGTLAYMSPEQALGKPIDHRTDLWALGVILYELLTGELPFQGQRSRDLVDTIVAQDPEPVRILAPEISVALEAIVLKALSKNVDERHQHAQELAAELRALDREPTPAPSKSGAPGRKSLPSIAVLPFINLSPDEGNEYFSDGLTDELINVLGQIVGLQVVSRTSVFEFKGKPRDVRQIGNLLDVETVLEGAVRRMDSKIRITVQLNKVVDGYALWSRSYDRDLKDVFVIQEEIAQTIARTLKVRLSAYSRSDLVRHQTSPEAYQLYLKGRYHWHKLTPDGFAKAVEYFQEALSHDSHFAPAYSGLADYYVALGSWSLAPPDDAWPKAKQAALQALELDEHLAEAHTSLAQVCMYYEWNWPEAEQHLLAARRLNASYLQAHVEYNIYLIQMGRLRDALEAIRLAQRIDPLSLAVTTGVAGVFYYGRRYDRAIEQCRNGLELDPQHVELNVVYGLSCLEKELFVEAATSFERLRAIAGAPLIIGSLGLIYGRAGEKKKAYRLLEELADMESVQYVAPFSKAMIHIGLGDKDRAFELLDQSAERRDALFCYLKVFPIFDPLRGDPRFDRLLERLHISNDPSQRLSVTS